MAYRVITSENFIRTLAQYCEDFLTVYNKVTDSGKAQFGSKVSRSSEANEGGETPS